MAFDASRPSGPESDPAPEFKDVPIDYVDWGMRIAVFGPLLGLYVYWIWTVLQTAFNAVFR